MTARAFDNHFGKICGLIAALALGTAADGAISVVDHYTFNDNVTPAGVTVLGTPSYSGGSLILNGSTGLRDASTVTAADNFGIEVIATFTGGFPAFSFPISLNAVGTNNGTGVVSIGSAVSGHGNGSGGAFGAFTASLDTEYRFAVVSAGGVRTFYLNGVAQAGTNVDPFAAPNTLTIGYNELAGGTAEGFVTGEINEVRTFTFAPGGFDAGSDLLSAATVPEPASAALLGLSGLLLMRRRRK